MYNPLPQCTKTGKLLRLLEASHREDRRRLHEDDERGEEDVGDRRRDASVRDIVPEAHAVRDALRVVVALGTAGRRRVRRADSDRDAGDRCPGGGVDLPRGVGAGRLEGRPKGARACLSAAAAPARSSMAPPDNRVRQRSLRHFPRARPAARFRERRRAGGVLGGPRGPRRLRADV